ncbi:hypothetical protein OJAV_G00065870 [Oryzias javanicus]|uniref:Death domain-containing protein n=1 Tax=Oryzias javanicus TaxID=123683 RepID=A0A437D6T7_ORYJA|nr:hypothetical protein OJAV_G00065870 [Oryzias javanicus]
MTEKQLIKRLKVKLIEILSADADFVLQHADSRSLLSLRGYQLVKSCRAPSEKLASVEELHANSLSPEVDKVVPKKQKRAPEPQDHVPPKKICCNGSALVKEKQLMMVARGIGRSWREIGRLALGVPSVKLEQIEEDHSQHSERVFHMLRYWRHCQREEATAAHLHSLLSQKNLEISPESIAFLLEIDGEQL